MVWKLHALNSLYCRLCIVVFCEMDKTNTSAATTPGINQDFGFIDFTILDKKSFKFLLLKIQR